MWSIDFIPGLIGQVSHAQFEKVGREKIKIETSDKNSTICYRDLSIACYIMDLHFKKDYSAYADHNEKEVNETYLCSDNKGG